MTARKVMTFFVFFGDPHLFGQHDTTSDVIDYCFMAAFTTFWLKTCVNIKYLKKIAVLSSGNTGIWGHQLHAGMMVDGGT